MTIRLRVPDLRYWNTATGAWTVDTGAVQIRVGPNAASLPLSGTVTIK